MAVQIIFCANVQNWYTQITSPLLGLLQQKNSCNLHCLWRKVLIGYQATETNTLVVVDIVRIEEVAVAVVLQTSASVVAP